jgi:hypothetical protein
LRDSPTEAPNVALARIAIGTTEVDDKRRRKAMTDPASLTDGGRTVARPTMTVVDLKEYVSIPSPINSLAYYTPAVWR